MNSKIVKIQSWQDHPSGLDRYGNRIPAKITEIQVSSSLMQVLQRSGISIEQIEEAEFVEDITPQPIVRREQRAVRRWADQYQERQQQEVSSAHYNKIVWIGSVMGALSLFLVGSLYASLCFTQSQLSEARTTISAYERAMGWFK